MAIRDFVPLTRSRKNFSPGVVKVLGEPSKHSAGGSLTSSLSAVSLKDTLALKISSSFIVLRSSLNVNGTNSSATFPAGHFVTSLNTPLKGP